jgi:V8-like Glu-specific endopeptidase
MPFTKELELELEEELEEEYPLSLWPAEAESSRQFGPSPRPRTQQRSVPAPRQNHVANQFDVPFRWIAHVAILKNGRRPPDSHGSGVLISDVHVLTAAHVVRDVLNDPGQFSVEVTIALDRGKSLVTRTLSKRPDVPDEFLKGDDAYDYAILTLSSRIADLKPRELNGAKLCYWGSSQCGGGSTAVPVEPGPPGASGGPMIVRPPSLNWETAFTAGYPRNRGGTNMWVFSGMLIARPQSPILIFTGSLTEGQSGSPVWIQQGGTINLVGVAVSRGSVNRIIRLSWDMVFRLNEWMLKAERSPEFEFKGDQRRRQASFAETRAQWRRRPVRFAESVYEVRPRVALSGPRREMADLDRRGIRAGVESEGT